MIKGRGDIIHGISKTNLISNIKQEVIHMKYTKPIILAQGKSSGSYAAGCPAKDADCPLIYNTAGCKKCERTK